MTRLAILACIGVMLAVTVLPTLRSYLRQQAEIDQTQALIASRSVEVGELQAQRRQWNDPAYVEQQARARLKFVRPGEKSYSVVDPPSASGQDATAASGPLTGRADTWYGQVWQSMVLADNSTALTPSK